MRKPPVMKRTNEKEILKNSSEVLKSFESLEAELREIKNRLKKLEEN